MKTSLNIQDSLFKAAQEEAKKNKSTISELISTWARIGREALMKQKEKRTVRQLMSRDLGGKAFIDLSSRRDWMDALDQ